jgi:photosystem II stability/assembly factor-like uncharacterized protein
MASIDGTSGWMVGDAGLCLETRDGGRTWTPKPLGTQATLRSVRFLNDRSGFIVGDGDPDSPKPKGHVVMGRQMTSGTVLWTSDGGVSWRKTYAPTNFEIYCAETRGGPVQFGNGGGAMHPDGDVLRSGAAAEAWNGSDFKSYRCFRALFDIRALDQKQWVAVGSPVVVGFVPPPTDPLFTNGACRVLVSTDGGEHWAPAKGSDGQGALRALAVEPKGQRLLAVGEGGGMLAGQDGGASWKPVTSGARQDLLGAAWSPTDSKTVVAVGEEQTVLLSSDGGEKWKRMSWAASGALNSVAFFGESMIVAGDGGVCRRASTRALREAKAVEPPAAPAKPAAKGPTKAQQERARVGAVSLYEVSLDAPAMNLKSTFQKEERIIEVTPTGYKVEVEVVKGTPPPGQPAKATAPVDFEGWIDFGSWKVGEVHEEKGGGVTGSRTRLADETVKVGENSWDCFVIQSKARTADGGLVVENKSWFAKSTEVPGVGFVKEEITQDSAGPSGKLRVSQTTTLLSVRRNKN